MKEAAGEANLTVVAIILIAVVVAVATPLVNSLMSNSAKRSCCTDAGGVWQGGCKYPKGGNTNNNTGISNGYKQCCTSANVNNANTACGMQGTQS